MEPQDAANRPRAITVVSSESWEFYMNQAKTHGSPVVVHFTASWCIPSVAMQNFFEEVASSYPDALFLTVDVDDVKEVASKLEVTAMPTFVFLKDGAQVDRVVGANPEETRKRVDDFIQSIRISMA